MHRNLAGQAAAWVLAGASLLAAHELRSRALDPAYEARTTRESFADQLESPGPTVLALVAAEHGLAWADLLWLSIVQETGRAATNREIRGGFLRRWADVATDLDPRYYQVYYGTAVNLTAYLEDADGSDALLEKGRRHIDQWTLPFLRGYNEYFLRADPEAAAQLWEAATHMPGSPHYLAALASRARYQAGEPDAAERMLEDLIEVLDGLAQRTAMDRLKAFRSEKILLQYDAACEAYLAAEGSRPPSAKALHDAGYLTPDVPLEDAFGAAIELDDDCVARSESMTVREFEALKNVGSPGNPTVETELR